MPQPKRRFSKQRTRTRRSAYSTLAGKNRSICTHCNADKLPHPVCRACGTYRGRQIIPVVVVAE
jgi:large subunit ribosomal protein L32